MKRRDTGEIVRDMMLEMGSNNFRQICSLMWYEDLYRLLRQPGVRRRDECTVNVSTRVGGL